MGFLVDVQWVAIPIAVCGESDCDWTGTYGLTEGGARSEAEAHWRWHADEWERRNEQWELNAQCEGAAPGEGHVRVRCEPENGEGRGWRCENCSARLPAPTRGEP